ncbi:MAG TPA: hypothetical protein VIT68_01025 [Candidatus Gracilibacteria bacterium]
MEKLVWLLLYSFSGLAFAFQGPHDDDDGDDNEDGDDGDGWEPTDESEDNVW